MLEIATASLRLDPRFNGPPGTGNGGYACGAVGELVDGPAEVSLRMPPPLGVPLDVSFIEDGDVVVRHKGALVAEARPIDEVDAHPPVRPSLAEAREGLSGHPGVTVSIFLPDASVPSRNGCVAPDMVWAALERPSCTSPTRVSPSLLARLAVERLDCVEVGEPTIALGWHIASEGRKHHTASALLGTDGRVLARRRALWITLADTPR
jgi:hypothetical protein